MSGQGNATRGCQEGSATTGVWSRKLFLTQGKERHKGRLGEAEMQATPEAGSDRESSDIELVKRKRKGISGMTEMVQGTPMTWSIEDQREKNYLFKNAAGTTGQSRVKE